MSETEIESLKQRISALRVEHHDLDTVISRMEESRIFGDDELHRLKKRKLFIKDSIVSLQRKLGRDATSH